jgi:hypothetical protein
MEKIEFKNIELYPQVDWDIEIATDNNLTEEEHAEKCGEYSIVMHQIIHNIEQTIEEKGVENLESHSKNNMMRMVEFLYCKFAYHHAMFYRRKEFLDLKKTQDNYKRGGGIIEHPVIAMREKLGETERSNLPLEHLTTIVDAIIKSNKEREKKTKPVDGGFDEAKKMFKKAGLKVEKPVGIGKEHDRDTVCLMLDGVPYHMYLMKSSSYHKKRQQEDADKEVKEFRELVEKYHPLIKRVHTAFKEQFEGLDDLWVLSGGGAQLQAFFGSNGKYIGILYLGMKGQKANPDKECTLVFQCYEDEERWQTYNKFKIDDLEYVAFDKTDPFKGKNERF